MFNPIIETAIGLVFVYLLLSMVCSALQEWIATLFKLRAKTLFKGITEMLCDDANLRDEIYRHPLVNGLSRKSRLDKLLRRTARPSYITPQTFSKTFLAVTKLPEALATNSVPTNAKNGQELHEKTRELIAALRATAPGGITDLQNSVEEWYNDAMDRASGWYRRQTQIILLVLALGVAAAFNADSLMLAKAFWVDPSLRAGVTAAAEQYVKDHPNGVGTTAVAPNAGAGGSQTADNDIANNYPSTTDGQPAGKPSAEPAYSAEQQQRAEQQYRAASAYAQQTTGNAWATLTDLQVPIGWCSGGDGEQKADTARQATKEPEEESEAAPQTGLPCTPERQLPRDGSGWWLKICGLMITMIALSQGAPFWFDLLKKVVNLRLAGDPPDEKKSKG